MFQRPFRARPEPRGRCRPRLLIEDPCPALQPVEFRRFEEAGFDVALCAGPGDGETCPLVAGRQCRLAEDADLVLIGPGLVRRGEIAAAHHERRPRLPVVAQVPRTDPGQCPAGCIADYSPASVDGEIRSLWRALDQRRPSPPEATGLPAPSSAVSPTAARLIDLLGW